MSSRVVYIKASNSVSTDSFILALRKLVRQRGNVRMIDTDNGTNFVAANMKRKRKESVKGNHSMRRIIPKSTGITWRQNPPMASNMGGLWERQICSAWNILNLLLRTHRESLHDESLITSLVEAEEILNSRSITYESISDVNSYVPLSTLRLLTMNTNVCGGATTRNFSGRSILLKRMKICPTSLWWVWDKWRKEVHATLQARKKWNHVKRNFEVGDIILVCNSISRNAWPTTQILKTFGDKEGLLCNVQLVIGKNLQTARRYQYLSNL